MAEIYIAAIRMNETEKYTIIASHIANKPPPYLNQWYISIKL